MSISLRRIYNSIDRLFDLKAISQELHYSRNGGESRVPKTARQAFQLVQPFVRELDSHSQLKMIVSQQGAADNGASANWEFFFNLFRCRAELVCKWALFWDEAIDNYGRANIEITVNPFPPVNSPIREAVREGKLLHRQVIDMWRQECKRRPTLPHKFRDTDIALVDLMRQGLDTTQVEFSLYTGQSPEGKLCWIAQARDATYYSPFDNSKEEKHERTCRR